MLDPWCEYFSSDRRFWTIMRLGARWWIWQWVGQTNHTSTLIFDSFLGGMHDAFLLFNINQLLKDWYLFAPRQDYHSYLQTLWCSVAGSDWMTMGDIGRMVPGTREYNKPWDPWGSVPDIHRNFVLWDPFQNTKCLTSSHLPFDCRRTSETSTGFLAFCAGTAWLWNPLFPGRRLHLPLKNVYINI